MIAKFVEAIVSVISGITKGFATTYVDGADTLLLTAEGSLTTFASFGIIILGIGLVTGIVSWIASRVGRVGR